MFESIPADYSESEARIAVYVNGIFYEIMPAEGTTAISLPAPGTVFKIANAFGEWNADQTVFTQYPESPWPGDKWEIKINPTTMNAEDADLLKIRVVPNPYIASSYLDLSPSSRRLEFINLPDRCTIRIYTLTGNLVNVLNHVGNSRLGWGNYTDYDNLEDNKPMQHTGWDNHSGTEPWNLRNRFGTTVASGLYLYHVTDSRGEEHAGKFYIIN